MTIDMRSAAYIDLDIGAKNMQAIKKKAGNIEVMAMVKADAYGHGAVEYSKMALKNGASSLGVATCDEGVELRQHGIKEPILLCGYASKKDFENVCKYDLTQTIYSLEMAEALQVMAKKQNKKVCIHIKIDTSLARLGFLPNDKSVEDIVQIHKFENLEMEGIYSHFSVSDRKDKSETIKQKEIFDRFLARLEEKGITFSKKHIANSAAIVDMPEMNLDIVRAGIILFGYYSSEEVDKEALRVYPVLTWKSVVSHVKSLKKGAPISYGQTYILKRDSIIATIPIGYADGYSRLYSNKGKVLISGAYVPIVGRVCMDQMMVDVTDIPHVSTGEEVVLIGKQQDKEISADMLANWRDSIPHEVLSNIARRIPRIYIQDGLEIVNENRLLL